VRQCFKVWSQRLSNGHYVKLYNEVYEDPGHSHGQWTGCEDTDELHTFLVDQWGNIDLGLWAETWDNAKERFLTLYPNATVNENSVAVRLWDNEEVTPDFMNQWALSFLGVPQN